MQESRNERIDLKCNHIYLFTCSRRKRDGISEVVRTNTDDILSRSLILAKTCVT